MILMWFSWTVPIEVARAQLASIEHWEAVGTLQGVVSFLIAASEHTKVARNPLQHDCHEILADHTNHHQFIPKLAATTIYVYNVRRDAQIPQLRTLPSVREDIGNMTWAKDGTVFMESILNRVDGSVLEIVDIKRFSETLDCNQLPLLGIKSLPQIGLESFHL
jgi:hypothetical protein